MAQMASSSFYRRALWLLPVLVAVFCYASSPLIGFVWDDHSLIAASPLVSGAASLADHFRQPFWSATLQSGRGFYRPLMTLSYAADFRLWNGWAGGFHITNVLLHAAVSLLVVALCRRAGASLAVAALLASAFAAFPRLTESVAWISGRTDVAAAAFGLAGLLAFRSGVRWRCAASGALMLLGLLCKEVAFAAVVALAVRAWMEAPASRRWLAMIDALPAALAVAFYVALRWLVLSGRFVEQSPGPHGLVAIALTASESVGRYALMLADPLRPRLQIGSLAQPQAWLSALGGSVFALAAAAAWRWRERGNALQWMSVGLGASAVGIVLHIVPLDGDVVAADRFLYLPIAALAVAVSPAVERFWSARRRHGLACALAAIAIFAVATAMRVHTWTSEIGLWRFEIAHPAGDSSVAHNELAVALMRKSRYDEALAELKQVGPDKHLLTAINQATCLDKVGRRSEAISLLLWLLQREPARTLARVNLMLMAARERDFGQARKVASELTTEIRDRSDIKALQQQLEDAATEWSSFPPQTPDESVAVRLRRAGWFERLGAVPEAVALWNDVIADPSVDPNTRLRAAAFLASHAREREARAAFKTIAAQGVTPHDLRSLEAILENRFQDD